MLNTLKTWLRGSGYYVYFKDKKQWIEVEDHINPFERLYDPAHKPIESSNPTGIHRKGLARIYFENFETGFVDCFNILLGNHYPAPYGDPDQRNPDPNVVQPMKIEKGHKGLLDLLIFPVISRKLYGFANYSFKHPVAKGLQFLSMAVVLPIIGVAELCRYILAAALTLAASPFIAAVHLFTRIHGKTLENRAEQLDIMSKFYIAKGQDEAGPQERLFQARKLIDTVAPFRTNGGKNIVHHRINYFYAETPHEDEPQNTVIFDKRDRIHTDRFYLYPPEHYKTGKQKSALAAFTFFVDHAREQLETNVEFRKQYGPK